MKSTGSTEMPESRSGAVPPPIAYVIPLRLETVYAPNAVLMEWLQSIHTRPISLYLLIRPTADEFRVVGFQPQVIISRLRDTYGQTNVAFSVLSEKHGRMLISVSLRKEIIESPSSSASSDGLENSSSAELPSGQESQPGEFSVDGIWHPPA